MDRRKSLKSLLIGSLGIGLLNQSCNLSGASQSTEQSYEANDYGRTPKEKVHDEKISKEAFFSESELGVIAILCDWILPANDKFGGANDAKVPEFIEFIVKEIQSYQLQLRGGMAWLDNFSNTKYGTPFSACNKQEQKEIIDLIAYPQKENPSLSYGVHFFDLMRNLTLTGYYTTRMGFDDLGYKGNTPNIWDGVPENVLKKHGLEYEKEWLSKCIDQSKRDETAQWDEQGNLLT